VLKGGVNAQGEGLRWQGPTQPYRQASTFSLVETQFALMQFDDTVHNRQAQTTAVFVGCMLFSLKTLSHALALCISDARTVVDYCQRCMILMRSGLYGDARASRAVPYGVMNEIV